jgi:hypothetical protein
MGVTGCLVSIVDRGIGMNPQRMLEENHRLIERERLDIAPTTVLGLFVVGRLARRHGLQVRLRPTAGGGTTADVAIPAVLLHQSAPASAVAQPHDMRPHDMRPHDMRPLDTRPLEGAARPNGTGTWSAPKIPAQRAVATVGAPVLVGAGALRSLPIGGFDWFARRLADGQGVESHAVAFAPTPPPTGAPPVPGMARRVPGAHLSPDLRDRPPVRPAQPRAAWQPRDPADVQATFDSYSVAWRRAGNAVGNAVGNAAGTVADRSPDRAHHTAMEGYQ